MSMVVTMVAVATEMALMALHAAGGDTGEALSRLRTWGAEVTRAWSLIDWSIRGAEVAHVCSAVGPEGCAVVAPHFHRV